MQRDRLHRRRAWSIAGIVGGLLGVVVAPGCARVPKASSTEPIAAAPMQAMAEQTSQTRCTVRRSADKPLVVEWPAAERAALEARAMQGLVAVRYEGCAMEVLSGCDVEGGYEFVALSPKQESVRIHDADELYARLPMGAASLEGTLARRGMLTVDMTIVGRQQADRHVIARDELRGRCAEATHVLTGLTVGAFSLYAGAQTELGARAQVGSAAAAAGRVRDRELLTRDGDPSACDRVPPSETSEPSEDAHVGARPAAPPSRCGALLRVEAIPLAEPVAASAATSMDGVGASSVPSPSVTSTTNRDALELDRARRSRRAATWRGIAIGSAVLSAASMGSLVGGSVLLFQADDYPVWETPSPSQLRKKGIGTAMVVSGSIGLVGFGALAGSAAIAARRAEHGGPFGWAPVLGPGFAGMQVRGRF